MIILITTILVAYFLPTMLAGILQRREKTILSIFLVNLFTGWTFFGWVGSLIWAIMAEPYKGQVA